MSTDLKKSMVCHLLKRVSLGPSILDNYPVSNFCVQVHSILEEVVICTLFTQVSTLGRNRNGINCLCG